MLECDIFLIAVEITDAAQRSEYLDQACAGNETLRSQVEALLQEHANPGSFLAEPALEQLAPPAPHAKDTAIWAEIDGVASVGAGSLGPTQWFSLDDPDGLLSGLLAPGTVPGSLGRLGHYEIRKILGRGGFGTVLQAFDDKLHRMVAIKLMSPELAATSPARKRFLREARTAAAIRHENVVQIYGVEEEPLPYLVMEYIPGQTLEQKLNGHGPLEISEVLQLGQQIALGLAAAHESGLIHRDIKPANILLESGIKERVKLTDFGLARSVDDASLTQSGVVAGTPMYMAPEQAYGNPLDQRADLFSLGSVLYQMVSGRPPFRAETTLAVLKRVTEETPRPIQDIIPETPNWLVEIISRLHAKRPEDRIQTARELAELLGRCRLAAEHGIAPQLLWPSAEALPAPAIQPVLPRAGRRRAAVTAFVVLACVVGIGLSEATGVTKLTATVIRLTTGEGTLVIETDDPGLSITIDGEMLSIKGAGVSELQLRPGTHTVVATRDGRPVRQDLIQMTRGGRQVLRVTLETEGTTPTPQTSIEPPLDTTSPKPESLAYLTPEFAAWEKEVAGLTAEQQIEAVRKKLMELNPGFDGNLSVHGMTEGKITELFFTADHITDLSPVRVLVALKTLICAGSAGKHGQLTDLSPLTGMSLELIDCSYTNVSDLSPLQGMQLITLKANGTWIADLSPLSGMPLRTLTADRTKIADLSPLCGMPLTQLNLCESEVTDLEPLANLPLTWLRINSANIKDLSPLKDLRLERLEVNAASVVDISALSGMPLTFLRISGAPVTNLLPLKVTPIRDLYIDYSPRLDATMLRSITTLKTINEKPVEVFCQKIEAHQALANKKLAYAAPDFQAWVEQTSTLPPEEQIQAVARKLVDLNPEFDGQVRGVGNPEPVIKDGAVQEFGVVTDHVTDISPLRVFRRLVRLNLSGSAHRKGKLIDLSPLSVLPLNHLEIYYTQVTDFSPLKGMELNYLNSSGTYVDDLSPLRGMPLNVLYLTSQPVHDLTPLSESPLKHLSLNHSYVHDLKPLRGTQLIELDLGGSRVADISPLKAMPLQILTLARFNYQRDTQVLQSIPTLQTINRKPVAEFWQEAEALRASLKSAGATVHMPQLSAPPRDTDNPQNASLEYLKPEFAAWENEGATMTAVQQLEAVRKKLIELNPGFDGELKESIRNDVLIGLEFLTIDVADISPVRALNYLSYHGVSGGTQGSLANL